jgi:hypothetical protein
MAISCRSIAFCTAAAAAAVAMAQGSVDFGVLPLTRSSTSRLVGVLIRGPSSLSPSTGGGVAVVVRRSSMLGVDAPAPEKRLAKICCAAFVGLTGLG